MRPVLAESRVRDVRPHAGVADRYNRTCYVHSSNFSIDKGLSFLHLTITHVNNNDNNYNIFNNNNDLNLPGLQRWFDYYKSGI